LLTSALLRNRNSSEMVSTSDMKRKFHWRKSGEIEEKHEIPREIFKEMAELNFLMMVIPEEHGGTRRRRNTQHTKNNNCEGTLRKEVYTLSLGFPNIVSLNFMQSLFQGFY